MKTVKLSVSSVILVSVLSGCSQQQAGSSPQMGSQQLAGGMQVFASQQSTAGQSSDDFYESKAHRKERLGLGTTQQQVESATPVVRPAKNVYKPKAPKAKVVVRKKPRPTHSVKNTQNLPAAKPGQCFAKVKLPAKYVTKTKRVLIQKASAKRVLVRAPQYRWINKKVLVRKASYKTRVIPAQYKNIVQRKMVKPAYVTWKKGHGAITRIDNMTGEIMCRVKIPAVYKTINKRVLVRPVQRIRTYIPAVYKTIKQKQRISSAIYKTVKKPARYKTQHYRVKVGNVRYVWRSILCKTNAPKHYRKASKINKNHRKVATKQYQSKKTVRKTAARSNYANQYNQTGTNYKHYLSTSKLTSNNTDSAYYEIQGDTPPVKNPIIETTSLNNANKVSKNNLLKAKKQLQAEKKRRIVYKIQKSLKAQGFNPGGLDGKMGVKTTKALIAFQKDRGLSIGKLNNGTFHALGMKVRSTGIQLASVR